MSPETEQSQIAESHWQYVEEAMGEFHAACRELEEFCAETIDQFGTLGAALAARGELVAQTAGASEADRPGPGSEETTQLIRELSSAMAERWQTLEQAQQAAGSQLAAVADLREQLAAVCHQLDSLGRQVGSLEQQLAEARETSRTASQTTEQAQQLQKQLAELTRRHEALRHERAELETELESVRVRAAELSEALLEQKQRSARLESEWAAELRRMRRALEIGMSELTEGAPAAGRARIEHGSDAGGGPATGRLAESATESDPVLDSVMAQFEIIQRDMARRRTKS